ncbi:hypothetical protein TNCV_2598481 [Trichonephila clavipes]|nr:hypothetical protein TNCV_2598481 [Trichonephila clavipes]
MHIASESGHQETALVFLKKGVPLHMSNKTGTKAIHTAAAHGFVEVIRNLLDRGENVDATTPENSTALHLAVQANQPEVVEILLGHGANVQMKAGKNGETALHMAAGVIDGHKCAELIIKSGADVNARNEDGETPLHNAARHGQLKTVTQLLEDGAGLDSLSKNGETATHYGSSINKDQIHYPTEDKDIIALLLQHGGSVTTETKKATAATMAGYQDLSEFERGVIVGAREMGNSISEVAMKFEFSCMTPFHECTVNIGNRVRQYHHWTVDDWKHVAWTDESRFQLNRANGRVRTGLGNFSRTMKHPTRPELLQSGSRSSEFRNFQWPPKSPDMNIFEYICDALERAVQKRSPTPLWTTV